MNLKIANLVAIQFGIFVGMMAWLAYSHFESTRPARLDDESRKGPVNSVAPIAPAPVAPMADPEGQHSGPEDYRADPDRAQPVTEQPVPVVHYQYSPEAVQKYTALAAQQYYRQIAPRRYPSSNVESRPVAAVPSYAKVEQQPAAVPTDYEEAPQTIAYDDPAQFVAYAQPYGLVPYSYARPFGRRCRPTPRHGALAPIRHRRHDSGMPRLSGYADFGPSKSFGVVQRWNADGGASCRPIQGFRHRGKR